MSILCQQKRRFSDPHAELSFQRKRKWSSFRKRHPHRTERDRYFHEWSQTGDSRQQTRLKIWSPS